MARTRGRAGIYTEPLNELKAVLQWHAGRKNQSLDDWFTRQLHERISGRRLPAPISEWPRVLLNAEQIRVTDELWTLDQLLKIAGWHESKKPQRLDVPLVVFRGWGRTYLIDGFNRVNFWRHTESAGPHRVLVVEPTGSIGDVFPPQ